MGKLIIEGGKRLVGEVLISGAKNAAVAILPGSILADEGICNIENLPFIDDIYCLESLLCSLGAKIDKFEDGQVTIDPSGVTSYQALNDEVKMMRASYYLLGILLAKFGRAEVVFPGGCDIGVRPIDQHIKGFEAMGAKVKNRAWCYKGIY